MEQASLRLMQSLEPHDYEFSVISLHPLGGLEPLLDAADIPAKGLNYGGPAGISIIPQLMRELRENADSDIIMTGPHLAAMAAMKLAGRKGSFLAVHFHHEGVKSKRSWRAIYKLALDRFRWITFPSNFVRDEACLILPEVRERSKVIRYPQHPFPVATQEETREARRELGLPSNAQIVGNAGWLIERKRFDVFLDVASKVASAVPTAHFAIAGGGEEEDTLRAQADALDLGQKVHFLGWQKDMRRFRNALDLLLFNSDWDALPVTPQEAVAEQIPLVSSLLHSGLREVFDEPLAARILTDHDADALAQQVIERLQNPSEAKAEADRSRQHFSQISAPETIAAEHLPLFLVS